MLVNSNRPIVYRQWRH